MSLALRTKDRAGSASLRTGAKGNIGPKTPEEEVDWRKLCNEIFINTNFQMYWGDETKEGEMDWEFRKHNRDKKCVQNYIFLNLNGREYLEDTEVDGSII